MTNKLSNLPIPREIIVSADIIIYQGEVLKNRSGEKITVHTSPESSTVYAYKGTKLIFQKDIK